MALIICPECGKQVSNKAKSCPNCGIEIANNPEILNTPRPSNEGTSTLRKTNRWVVPFVIILAVLTTLVFAWLFLVKNPQSQKFTENNIESLEVTPNSVGPIFLGELINNIPTKGDFYDRIEKRYDWIDITDLYRGNEIMLEIRSDDKGKIFLISICSPKIALRNGIHIGMTGEELESKYYAKITPKFEVDIQWLEYKIPGYNSYTFEGDLPLGDYGVDWFSPTPASHLPNCKLDRIYIMNN